MTTNADTEARWRRLLWLNHGHSSASLYGDDGEMQCHMCLTWDYRRATIEELEQNFSLTAARSRARAIAPGQELTHDDLATIQEALAIGTISYDGDGWFAKNAGYEYESAEATLVKASTLVQAALARAPT